jgi:hypothetical protein
MSMIELNGTNIYAVPYSNRRALKPVKLPDGSIVETPTSSQRSQAPKSLPAFFQRPDGFFIGLFGVYLLSTGSVAAVYGGTTEAIGQPPNNQFHK